MAVKFRKSAIKALKKISGADLNRIQQQIHLLLVAIETQGIIPFNDLDIKVMKGDWAGFYRLRVGDWRIIFRFNLDTASLEIYAIGSRGDIYK